MTREAKAKVGSIQRVNGARVVLVRANPAPGIIADNKLQELEQYLTDFPLVTGVYFQFRGANEEQEQSAAFLLQAFALSMALMAILLVTQFNSYYQSLLILSAVLLSTPGVLLVLLITVQPFSVMLTGIGVIAGANDRPHRCTATAPGVPDHVYLRFWPVTPGDEYFLRSVRCRD